MALKLLRRFQKTKPEKPLGGRYKIIKQLGVGGFGQTFLAEDSHLPGSPKCVVKQLKPKSSEAENMQTARRLFDTEAKVLYQLGSHNQIPRLLGHFEDHQDFYLAQEFIEGEALTKELVVGQPWSESRVLNLLIEILQVLVFVHQQQVIHRDIKPANLMRRHRDGKIVLIDFGAVKEVRSQPAKAQKGQTELTIAIGTKGYMPNEQLAGNPQFSSDVYAVGIIGIQALTGLHPKNISIDPRTSEIQWRDALTICQGNHAPIQVSPELGTILDHMVLYDFRQRYSTAAEALQALQSIGAPELDVPTPSPLPSVEQKIPTTKKTPKLVSKLTAPASTRKKLRKQRRNPAQKLSFNLWLIFSVIASVTVTFIVTKTFLPTEIIPQNIYKIIYKDREPDNNPTEESALSSVSRVSSLPSPNNSVTTELAPQVVSVLSQADSLREAGDYQKALEIYNQILEDNSQVAEAYWGSCYSLNKLDLHQKAISACEQAIELKPQYPEALSSRGYALSQLEKRQEALESFQEALELQPDLAEATNNLGVELLEQSRSQEALATFEKAILLKENYLEAWTNKGVALWRLERYEVALDSFDKALEIQPDYQKAKKLRQQAQEQLLQEGRRQEAPRQEGRKLVE
ncbi:MAG: tetratricopeptide repeat protein [Symploca sp. SIO1B1]|nr:tetratricopeptide repeat protein [Symploca sp. SIO1B1]